MTAKQQVQRLLNELPEECIWEEVQYRLYVLGKIDRGLLAAERGETVSHKDLKERIKARLTL